LVTLLVGGTPAYQGAEDAKGTIDGH
jgi:hypothetical protein